MNCFWLLFLKVAGSMIAGVIITLWPFVIFPFSKNEKKWHMPFAVIWLILWLIILIGLTCYDKCYNIIP